MGIFGFIKSEVVRWKQAKALATDIQESLEVIKEARKKELAELQKIRETAEKFESFILERECK